MTSGSGSIRPLINSMFSRKTSVAVSVIIALVLMTTLVLGSFGVINYLGARNRELENLRADLKLDADQIAPSLALPMWNFDRPQINEVVESMMRDPVLYGMTVVAADHKTVICARKRDEQWNLQAVEKEFPSGDLLVEKRSINFSHETLATVTLFATTKFVEERLTKTLRWTAVNILTLDLILTVCIYLLLRLWVLKPLQEVEAYAAIVSAGGRAGPVREFHGELDNLRASIEKMIAQLELRYNQLQTETTERKQAEGRVQHSHEQLRALSSRLETLREEERTHIAREIHDHLGQLLTALKMDIRLLERKIAGVSEVELREVLAGKITSAQQLTDETIIAVQKIAFELRPGVLDRLGLVAAIEVEAQIFQTRTGLPCEVSVPKAPIVLTQKQATAMFRIFQELLTNITRPAKAARVAVLLAVDGNHLVLEVRDDGVGFQQSDLEKDTSLGILGMQERVAILGGSIAFGGPAGHGTTVTVKLPMG